MFKSSYKTELHGWFLKIKMDISALLTSFSDFYLLFRDDGVVIDFISHEKSMKPASSPGAQDCRIQEALSEPNASKLMDAIQNVLVTRTLKNLELEFSTGEKPKVISLILVPYSKTEVVCVGRDVSESRQLQDSMRESEDRFRRLADATFEAITVTDGGIHIDVNKRFEEMYQYSREEILGTRPFQFMTEASREVVKQHMNQGFEEPYEVMSLRKDGSTFPTEVRGRAIPYRGKTVRVTVLRDISERKRAEAAQTLLFKKEQEARTAAEEANRSKDFFLAMLSHELRTPLTPILAWVQMLKKGQLSPERSRYGLDVIEKNAKIQAELINDLLDLSRIVMGRLRLDLVHMAPVEAVMAALDSVRLNAEEKSIRIETRFDPFLGLVLVDPVRLQQILWNLLTNAVKFTPERGTVAVRCERVTHAGRDYAEMRVSDTGIGIKPEFLPVLFERFSQADPKHSPQGGLGLGLAITRNLVELHEGSIEAMSAGEGKGATFLVRLPIVSD